MQAVALICVRAGSKGIPGKNLAEIGGQSLIARAIGAARAVPGISRVIVSTDGDSIAEAALAAGAEVTLLAGGLQGWRPIPPPNGSSGVTHSNTCAPPRAPFPMHWWSCRPRHHCARPRMWRSVSTSSSANAPTS